jgi:hypothetical protein
MKDAAALALKAACGFLVPTTPRFADLVDQSPEPELQLRMRRKVRRTPRVLLALAHSRRS